MLYICTKFHEIFLNGFRIIERTRFVTDRQTDIQLLEKQCLPQKGERDILILTIIIIMIIIKRIIIIIVIINIVNINST